MANLDLVENNAAASPLDLLTNASIPHGYGQGKDGRTAVKVVPHAPKVNLDKTVSETDSKLVNDLMQLFSEARAYRRPLVPMWKRSANMLYNKFRWGASRPDWLPSPLVPEIYPICEAIVGWMGDQRIGYTVAPASVPNTSYFDYFQGLAMDLETAMDATWQVNCEENEWTKSMWDTVTYGTGIMKTTWDMILAGGQGDAISRRVSPFCIYPDPQATCLEDANYIVEAKRMSVQELDRRFPGSEALFPSGGFGTGDLDNEPTQLDQTGNNTPPKANPGAIAPVTSPRYGNPGGARQHATDIPGVTVFEFWLREHEAYDNTVDIKSGEKTTKVYDTWRIVVVAENHVLMNEPVDNLWSHGKHPYSRVVLDDTGEFWGRSLVDLLTPSQVAINRLLAALQSNIELTGNPIWKDATNGANGRTTMTNKPGERIRTNVADSNTGWLNPPPMNPQMMNLLQYHLQRMEAISGLSAITKGGTPGGSPAQNVVDALQEAAFVRIRQYLRHLEYAMRDAGTKRASLMAENYTTPRMMAIAGPGGERTSLTLKARHFLVPTSEGATPMQFQLLVDAGSRLHTSRAMREDRAVQFFTLGLIDRQAALSAVNEPNASVIAKRMDDKEAQMAAMGQAGGSGPGARQRANH